MIHFKDNKNKSALSTRWAQMSKQEQIIERKKMEIQTKLEAQKQAAALAAQAKLANVVSNDDKNIFSNDGSFMSQYKALLEKQQEKKDQEERERKQDEDKKNEQNEDANNQEGIDGESYEHEHCHSERPRERHRRWNEHGQNQASNSMHPDEDRRRSDKRIPSLMNLPIMPPGDQSPDDSHTNNWQMNRRSSNDNSDEQGNESNHSKGPNQNFMGPGPMGPMGPMGPRMGPGSMGPGPMPPMGPNMGPPMMGPGGPMPPFMGGPPPFPMPPNFMGPNGPRGPCGPGGPMPPNMCGPGPNGPMPPYFGPPFPMGPNGPPNSMIPPNSMMPPNGNMPPFMGPRPPFGPNGPNFGNSNGPNYGNGNGPNFGNGSGPNFNNGNGPNFNNGNGPNFNNNGNNSNFGNNGNGPPMPFMPPNSMGPNPIPRSNHDQKSLDDIPPSEPIKVPNMPPPLPLQNIPTPKDMDPGHIPAPPSQVFSGLGEGGLRAATEVAANGDHWELVLKAIHSQDQSMWFLHNTNSNEYKMFRELVTKLRSEQKKLEVKPEDKYEPEFCLEDDSNDSKPDTKEEFRIGEKDHPQFGWDNNSTMKREYTSSQSDEESEAKKERRKRKKSRWGNDPPLPDIKPPGVMAPFPVSNAQPSISEEAIKLAAVNRNNPALTHYAKTNYGTTNLSPEDWKKCEDNFKLNLLYQDMMKKRQEVERLAAAGKHKYEYDSDEDTSEGTWEHRLRYKEMNATEKWATELTKQAEGKHHIGDFLPPEELKKFMAKYSGLKNGNELDFSDYKEFKLKEDNVGFKMLQKLGWNEGQGLGADGSGIVDPVNKANQPVANLGLGAASADGVTADDDEFDAYRKRMMLAYRFRPNPLNNPRRPYY